MYLGELVSAILFRIEVADKRLVSERQRWNEVRIVLMPWWGAEIRTSRTALSTSMVRPKYLVAFLLIVSL